ncbi:hypothetical protein E4U54_006915 [Claviceps lovelessii]|nr:hypothetical protein E4U54_006915 [Claviceps lovelessii]
MLLCAGEDGMLEKHVAIVGTQSSLNIHSDHEQTARVLPSYSPSTHPALLDSRDHAQQNQDNVLVPNDCTQTHAVSAGVVSHKKLKHTMSTAWKFEPRGFTILASRESVVGASNCQGEKAMDEY